MFFKFNLKLILEPEVSQVELVGKNRCRYAPMNSVDYVEKPRRKGRSMIKLAEIKWLVHLFLEGNINVSTLCMEVVIMEPHATGTATNTLIFRGLSVFAEAGLTRCSGLGISKKFSRLSSDIWTFPGVRKPGNHWQVICSLVGLLELRLWHVILLLQD